MASSECEASEGLIFMGRTQEVVCLLTKLMQIDALLCKVVKGVEQFPEYLCDGAPPFVFPEESAGPQSEPEDPEGPEDPEFICPLECTKPQKSEYVFICEITNALKAEFELTKSAVCELYRNFILADVIIKTPCLE